MPYLRLAGRMIERDYRARIDRTALESRARPHWFLQRFSRRRYSGQKTVLSRPTLTVRAILPLLVALRGRGVDVAALLREARIDGAILFDTDARIAHEDAIALWRRASVVGGDPDIALKALEIVDVKTLALRSDASEFLMVQLFAASASLGDALGRLAHAYPIVDGGVRLELLHDHGRLRLRYLFAEGANGSDDESRPPAFVVFQLGLWARLITGCAVERVPSLAIAFRGACSGDAREHARVLGCGVCFAAAEDEITLDANDAHIAFSGADAARLRTLEERAEAALARASPIHVLVEQVRTLIASRLESGNPSAEAVADALGMSARTLARKLEAIGTSHRQITDELRADLAQRWLSTKNARVEDVSRRLGFSDASAFHRAFKRWFGRAPSDLSRAKNPP